MDAEARVWMGPIAALVGLMLTVIWIRFGWIKEVGLISWGFLAGMVLTWWWLHGR